GVLRPASSRPGGHVRRGRADRCARDRAERPAAVPAAGQAAHRGTPAAGRGRRPQPLGDAGGCAGPVPTGRAAHGRARCWRCPAAAHLLLACAVGLSIWAMPAAALALYRLGVRRRAVLDVAAILLVAGTSMLAMSIDSRIRGAAPEVAVLVTMGIMVVLALIP